MRILNVKLQNFKGFSSLDFNFEKSSKTIIYGKSGCGKTTILEAFKFVLGLNSSEPYPTLKSEKTGGVEFVRDLECSVEFLIEKDNRDFLIKRTATQKYRTNKETNEKEFSGWEANDYQFDGVPMIGNAYKEKIAEFFGVEKYEYLNFLIDSFYFNTDTAKWTWKERQQILYKIMNVDNALQELKSNIRFDLIKEYLEKGKSTTEILKLLNADKKSISENKEKNEILLNEKTNELNQYKDINFKTLEEQRSNLEKEIETENQLLSVQTSQSAELEIKKQIQDIQSKITQYNIEYDRKTNDGRFELQKHKNVLENIKVAISRDESELKRQSVDWNLANTNEWKGDAICPTCKRPLDEHLIKETKLHFENDKKSKLETIKTQILKLRDEIAKNKDLYTQKLTIINNLENEILTIKPNEEITKLESDKQLLLQKLNEIKIDTIDYTKLNRIKEELRAVNEKLAFRLVKEQTENRLKQLKEEQIDLSNKEIVNAKTRRVFEEYTLSIIDKVNDTVNSGFDGISWLLFDTHTASAENSISETCELLYEDKPYSTLSTGEKVQSNFITIKGLQQNLGLELPIFIDETQSSTGFERIANQQVIEFKTTETNETNLVGIKIDDVYNKN